MEDTKIGSMEDTWFSSIEDTEIGFMEDTWFSSIEDIETGFMEDFRINSLSDTMTSCLEDTGSSCLGDTGSSSVRNFKTGYMEVTMNSFKEDIGFNSKKYSEISCIEEWMMHYIIKIGSIISSSYN